MFCDVQNHFFMINYIIIYNTCIYGFRAMNQTWTTSWKSEAPFQVNGGGSRLQFTSYIKWQKKLITQWRSSKVRILKFWNTKSCMISFKQKNIWGGHQLSMRNALTVWFIDIEVSNPRVNMYLVNSSSGMALDHNGRLVSQYTRSGTIIITGGSRYSSSYEGMQEINGFTKTTIAFQFWSYRINRH